MKGLTWPAVGMATIGVTGFVVLYVLIPADDPMRGALVTAFNALIGVVLAVALGRRQQQTDEKIDRVLHQTNGHADAHPPSAHRHDGTRGPAAR